MVNDLVSDGLTRIRNASTRRLDKTQLLHSKLVESVIAILQEKGYIESFEVVEQKKNRNSKSYVKFINVVLKYDEKGYSVISELKRISKPGRRVYKQKDEIKSFKNGYGTIIISTSKGVIDNNKAHAEGVGGEILCSVW
jgi:small subunit ribosomal protein S8